VIFAAAMGAAVAAGILLPLPPWAKALPELLVGLLFRVQIWRATRPLREAASAACERALRKWNTQRYDDNPSPSTHRLFSRDCRLLTPRLLFHPPLPPHAKTGGADYPIRISVCGLAHQLGGCPGELTCLRLRAGRAVV
jgi:hypothetical protein